MIDIMEWPGQFEKEKAGSVMRCRRLDVAFVISCDQEMESRKGQAHFCIKTKMQVEKKLYGPRVDRDHDNVGVVSSFVCSLDAWFCISILLK